MSKLQKWEYRTRSFLSALIMFNGAAGIWVIVDSESLKVGDYIIISCLTILVSVTYIINSLLLDALLKRARKKE